MKMKSLLFALIMCFLFMGALFACTGGEHPENQKSYSDSQLEMDADVFVSENDFYDSFQNVYNLIEVATVPNEESADIYTIIHPKLKNISANFTCTEKLIPDIVLIL